MDGVGRDRCNQVDQINSQRSARARDGGGARASASEDRGHVNAALTGAAGRVQQKQEKYATIAAKAKAAAKAEAKSAAETAVIARRLGSARGASLSAVSGTGSGADAAAAAGPGRQLSGTARDVAAGKAPSAVGAAKSSQEVAAGTVVPEATAATDKGSQIDQHANALASLQRLDEKLTALLGTGGIRLLDADALRKHKISHMQRRQELENRDDGVFLTPEEAKQMLTTGKRAVCFMSYAWRSAECVNRSCSLATWVLAAPSLQH